jgi:hypothetical protein
MKNLSTVTSVVLMVGLGASLANSLSHAPDPAESTTLPNAAIDPVAASFERELNRQPVPETPSFREAIDQDVLYRRINRARWSPEPGDTESTQYTDSQRGEDDE